MGPWKPLGGLDCSFAAAGADRYKSFWETTMRDALSKSLIVVAVLLAMGGPARAQPLIAYAESIESTVANADLVFIAKLVKFGDAEELDGRVVHNTKIAIEETLKADLFTGEPYRRLQMYMPRNESVLADWKKRSCRLLVAYDGYAPYATTVIELVPGKMQVLKADFTLLRDPDAVIRAAEEALRRMPPAVKRIHTFGLQVPRELVAETTWAEYHGLVLNVPVNEPLEKRAIKYIRSKSYQKREEGVRALRYFKSEDNISRVKMLLDDSGWAYLYHAQENNGIEVRIYGVRREAYRTLTSWGIKVEMPMIRKEVHK